MARVLDRNQGVPLYTQLKAILLEEIRAGRWKPNDRLPNEDQLASTYGVSLITLRRALSDLAAAGHVRREQGRGTFVAHPAVAQGPRELTSFTYDMAKRGVRSSSRVLAQDIVPAGETIAEALRTLKGAHVFRLRRLRLADGEPMAIQTAHIPVSLAPDLVRENFGRASLYAVLEKKYGIVPSHAREIHSAVLLNAEDSRILGLPEGSLGLAAKRITYLENNCPFELVHSVMRADRYQIVLDLVCAKKR